MRRRHSFIGLTAAAIASCLCPVMAQAGDFSNAATYNSPIDTAPGSENAPVDASIRDANGNLTIVNGQFTSAASAKAFAQSGASALATGVGAGGSGAGFAGASAIGNALNVVTVGNNNTVIVDSQQTNNGNITANTTVNGH
jgi:holdfast attachment protein HfaA